MVDALPLDELQLHVPLLRTRLIGRDIERATSRKLLIDETTPLLTLTAPRGVGKTRLALAIAGDAAEHFVAAVTRGDLVPSHDPELVPMTVASALGVNPFPPMAAKPTGDHRHVHPGAANRGDGQKQL
jgi:hypothetical protein